VISLDTNLKICKYQINLFIGFIEKLKLFLFSQVPFFQEIRYSKTSKDKKK